MIKKWLFDKRLWIVFVAVGLGGFAAWSAQQYLAQRVATLESQAKVPMRTVIVAAMDLAPGDQLNEETLMTREFPQSWLPSVAIEPERFDQVSTQVLMYPVRKGEPLLWTHLEKHQVSLFSSKLEEGRRAITIAVDEINSIAGLIQPGDWIDMYVSFDFRKKRMTSLLLSKVKVLATGQQADVVLGNLQDQQRRSYSTVTLDSSPEDAVKLIVARQSGALTAVLRSPQDVKQDARQRSSSSLSKMLGLNASVTALSKKIPVVYGDKAPKTLPRIMGLNEDDEDEQESEHSRDGANSASIATDESSNQEQGD